MKRKMRGVERFFVMILSVIFMTESVLVPVRGEMNKGADAQSESVIQQISGNAVAERAEESVSANFVFTEESEVSENKIVKADDEILPEKSTIEYSGTDGDLEWSIDSDGYLMVTGKGDFKDSPDWLNYRSYIKSAYVNVQEITSMKRFFNSCTNLTEIYFDEVDTSNVTDMSEMFSECYKLSGLNLRDFNTENVTTMYRMFYCCYKLEKINVSGFETDKVEDMMQMFGHCIGLKSVDISQFNMSNVTTIKGMFSSCSVVEGISLGDIDTSKVIYMDSLFSGCKALESIDVSELDTENVLTMQYMFSECQSLTELDISTFDMRRVVNTGEMFYNCSKLKELKMYESVAEKLGYAKEMFYNCEELQSLDLSNIKTDLVYNMESMFRGCRKLKELDVSHFRTSNVVSMAYMFANCSSVKELKVDKFDTHIVNDMTGMFLGCTLLSELDVSSFETDAVISMSNMFSGCVSLKKLDVSGFDTSAVKSMGNMFASCASLTELDVSNFDTENVIYMAYMFYGCDSLEDLKFGNKNVALVTSTESMFEGCSSLKEIDITWFNGIETRDMSYMFKDCRSLKSIDKFKINAYSLENVRGMFQGCSGLIEGNFMAYPNKLTDMSCMFKDCSSMKSVSLPSIEVETLERMSRLFEGCSNLTKVELPKGKANKLESVSSMFEGCSSLEYVNMKEFQAENIKDIAWLFYNCSSLKSVNLDNFDTTQISDMCYVFAGCDSLQEVDLSSLDTENVTFTRGIFYDCDRLVSVSVSPSLMEKLVSPDYNNFDNCELFSDIYYGGTMSEWEAVKPMWQNCPENRVRCAAIHLNDGAIVQNLQQEGNFSYIENGGFGSQKGKNYSYACDMSKFFENSFNYQHDLAKMSVRVSMAAMSTNDNTNSSNIEALMDDLNVTNRVIHYPKPSYDSIGYAMGTRRIYHNNQKRTLIMITIRGGGYGTEWGGNANVGSGEHHAGFNIAANQVYVALNQYIGALKESGFTDGNDVVVWISGYSRGAATANLLAAKLDDDYLASGILEAYGVKDDHVSAVKNTSVFAFCFECPQNTTAPNSSLKYANIINIINPKDFVTYVAMNNGLDWRFHRYGKDLVLPDEANTNHKDFSQYEASMKSVYQSTVVPEIGANQSILVKDAAKRLGNIISKDKYLIYYQKGIQEVAASLMATKNDWGQFLFSMIPIIYAESLGYDDDYRKVEYLALIGNVININARIGYAHYPELCMAWMDSISEEVLTKQKSFRNVFINCPVDVYIYQDDILVGMIKNDVPQEVENGVITMLDENGQKRVVLPGDEEYKLVYKATSDGSMTISTSRYVQAEGIPESVTSYYELPLKTGTTYETMTSESEFILTDARGENVIPSAVQSGEEVTFYQVQISVEGNGEVTGNNTYGIGEFAKVSAYPAEGERFLGWYKDGKLISGEVEYRFCVKEDTTLTAKFTTTVPKEETEKPLPDEKETIKVGSKYTINKHTYKVTDVKKKTVTFLKTASKAKTITIPSTVKINGELFKVTAMAANALKGNKKVTKIKIGSNVASIGKKAFAKCTALKTVTIPSKVKSIGESAFYGCKKLQKVVIGKGVTKIGKKAFYKCNKLKSITIKTKKLKTIGKYAFKNIATKAKIKCPSKQYKKYKKMITKSKIGKKVTIK